MGAEKFKILYVDDKVTNLLFFKESFYRNYEVITCRSGKEGLEVFKKDIIDLVIADLRMPFMDGIEFFEKIFKINPGPPRILLTAYGDLDSVTQAINRGKIFHYVEKPWHYDLMNGVIENALKSYQIQKENRELTHQLKKKTLQLNKELINKKVLLEKIVKSENSIKKSNNYLQNIINTAGSVIIILSDNFRILEWNKESEKYFGYKKREVEGLDFFKYCVKQKKSHPLYENLLKTKNGKSLKQFNCTINHKSGLKHNFIWRISQIKSIERNLTNFVLIGQNIEEIIKVEEHLRISEEKFSTIFHASPDLILLTSLDGSRIIETNDKIYEIVGYKKKDIEENIIPSKILWKNENDRKEFVALLEKQGSVQNFEAEFRTKFGNVIVVLISSQLIELRKEKLILGIVHDISERKEAEEELRHNEEQFRTIYENSAVGYYRTTVDGKIILANPALVQMLGYNSFKEFVSINLNNEGFSPETPRSDFISALEEHDKVVDLESTWIRADGRYIYVSESARGIRDENGNLLYYDGIVIDITQRKIAEKKQQESEALFKAITEQTNEGIIIATKKGKYMLVNHAFCRMTGYCVAELRQKNISNMILPETSKNLVETIIKKGVGTKEIQVIRKDKSKFYAEVKANIITIGEVKLVLAFISDITTRFETEKALRRSSSRLREAQKIAHIGHYTINHNTNQLEWSDEVFNIFGQSSKDYKPTINSLLRQVHPDDSSKLQALMKKSVSSKQKVNLEHRIITPDNKVRWVRTVWRTTHDSSSKPKRTIGIIQDITDIKSAEIEIRRLNEDLEQKVKDRTREYQESEKKFRDLIHYVPDGILLINEHGKITLVNKQIEKLFGYKENEILNKSVEFLLPKVHRDIHKEYVNNYLEKSENLESGSDMDLIAMHKNNHEFPVDIRFGVVTISGERNVIAIIRDITEKKRSEVELKQAKIEAEAANKAKSIFLANMSHEIRTPLNAVLGIADILYQQINDSVHKNYLETIKSSGNSLLALINDILDLSKIEAGKININYNYFNLRSAIKEVESIFAFKAQEKQLEFKFEISDNIPPFINLDEFRFKQILINLLSNAIKFTSHGFVKLIIKSTNFVKLSSKNLMIQIKDSGIGIKPEFISEIFDSFSQQEDQITRKYGGSGLGLAITKRLIELMNGTLLVESQPDIGSTFTIVFNSILWLDKVEQKSPPIKKEIRKENFQASKVLIVDDIKENRDYLIGAFSNTKISVGIAEDGIHALQTINDFKPDLIITDIYMPKMDGFELCEALRNSESFKEMPIIGISASVIQIPQKKLKSAALDAFITKPFTLKQLYKVLSKYLPYEEQRKSSVKTKNKPIQNWDEASLILKSSISDEWQDLVEKQPIKEVEAFSYSVGSVAKKYKIDELAEYSKSLQESINSFNIDNMLQLLRNYPKLINELDRRNM